MNRGWATRGGVVLLGAALALTACSRPEAGTANGNATDAVERAVTTPSGSPKATSTVAGTATTKPGSTSTATVLPEVRGNASGELAAFFATATKADAHLRRAAELVNAGVTKDGLRIPSDAVREILAVDLDSIGATIPAGMPPELMRRVLLTYSDLVSRYYAMRLVTNEGDSKRETFVPADPEDWWTSSGDVIEALGNGAPAARRFAGDLAAAKALARTTRLSDVGPRSRAAAELSARLTGIVSANGCCMSTGGEVFTKLAPLRWKGGKERSSWTGVVGGVGFTTTWTGKLWDTQLEAG